MADDRPKLGTLVDAYVAWHALEEEIVEDLASYGLVDRAALLPEIVDQLPRESGLRTIAEVEELLYDEPVFARLSEEVDPAAMEAIVLESVRPAPMRFFTPIALVGRSPLDLEIGGRAELRLTTQELHGAQVAFIGGTVRVGHWSAAARHALSIAEEVSGVLLALDLLRVPSGEDREWTDADEDEDVFKHLAAVVTYDLAGTTQEQTVGLPWSVQHAVSRLLLTTPRERDDIEEAKAAAGAPEPFERRYELFAAAFAIGGPKAKNIRRAARFLRKAATADTPGESFLSMATSLESLLVAGSGDLEKRVCDAVTFLLGTSYEERERLRSIASTLYDCRSTYIHQGEYQGSERQRVEAMRLVRDVIARELRTLAASGARSP
jgi:hypothetical protein